MSLGRSGVPETPERVFEALLVEHLDEKRRRWRDLDIERALYIEGEDWMARYRSAVGADAEHTPRGQSD